jgi:hypothetical protein
MNSVCSVQSRTLTESAQVQVLVSGHPADPRLPPPVLMMPVRHKQSHCYKDLTEMPVRMLLLIHCSNCKLCSDYFCMLTSHCHES